jgi:hypothetical protein
MRYVLNGYAHLEHFANSTVAGVKQAFRASECALKDSNSSVPVARSLVFS